LPTVGTLTGTGIQPPQRLPSHQSTNPEDPVSKEERDERAELEQDHQEDLELDEKQAENVKGGKAKTADKAFNAMSDYIKG
jgi:hypothetical protein